MQTSTPAAASALATPATLFGRGRLEHIVDALEGHQPARVLLVAGPRSYEASGASARLEPLLERYELARLFRSDTLPTLADIEAGRRILAEQRSEAIVAVGGGGVLDVAKAIRVPFSVEGDGAERTIRVDGAAPPIPLVAVPTTAGTGAETTQFAVLYIDGVKHSIDHPRVLPDRAIVDPSLTDGLSPHVTAVTGMDALAQGIESIWSVAATDASTRRASRAVRLALDHLEPAVRAPTRCARDAMAMAAHLSGRAINETRTTACHAVSYPITAHYGIAHGHAVALTLPQMLVFNAGVEDAEANDPGGAEAVRRKIGVVLRLLGVGTPEEGAARLRELMRRISLPTTLAELGIADRELIIAEGFNPARAGNNPRRVTPQALRAMLG